MPTRKVADLKPHPENARIYADAPTPDLVESVRGRGVLQPLLITHDDLVISGHRRLTAAREAGLEEVPVSVFASADELDILQALVESNRQRTKTNEQIGREATVLIDVEAERAKRRKQEAGTKAGKVSGASRRARPSDPEEAKSKGVENFPHPSGADLQPLKVQENFPEPSEAGQARDKAGEALGISGKQAEKAAAVVKVIDSLESGDPDEAEKIRKALNKGSIHKAYTLAVQNGHIPANGETTATPPSNGRPTPDQAEADDSPPPVPCDEDGTPLPAQAVAAFEQLPELRKFCRALDDAGKELERLGKSPVGAHVHWQSARSQLKAARSTVWQGRPAYVCPYCRGENGDCRACRGNGFVTAAAKEQAAGATIGGGKP